MSAVVESLQERLNPYGVITYLYSDGQHALISGENGVLKIHEVTEDTFRTTIKWYNSKIDSVTTINVNDPNWFQILLGIARSVKPTQFR